MPDDERTEPGAAGEPGAGAANAEPGAGAMAEAADAGSPPPAHDPVETAAEAPGFGSVATGALYAPSTRLVLVAASVIVIIIGMKIAASIITPVILSLVITIAIAPLLSWQVRKGVPSGVAFMTTLIVSGVAGILIVLLMAASLASFIRDLPNYADELQPYWDALMDGLAKIGVDTSNLLSLENLEPKTVLSAGANFASNLIDVLSSLMLMALTVLFMLMEASTISVKLKSGVAGGALRRMEDMTADMRSFIKVTAYMGAIVALLDTVLLLIMGVPNALLWGFLAFFFSFIPFIGFVIAMIPPVIMALITGGWVSALIVTAGYIIMNTISDNLFKPRIMGSQTNLSPLVVFLSVMLWGWVFGSLGALLAVPVTLLAKRLVIEAYDEWKWFSVVIGDMPREPKTKQRRTMLSRVRPHRDKRK